MAAYLLRRLWQIVPTLIGVVLLVFLLFKGFGGDPADILAGQNATAVEVQGLHRLIQGPGPEVHRPAVRDRLYTNDVRARRAGVSSLFRGHGLPGR